MIGDCGRPIEIEKGWSSQLSVLNVLFIYFVYYVFEGSEKSFSKTLFPFVQNCLLAFEHREGQESLHFCSSFPFICKGVFFLLNQRLKRPTFANEIPSKHKSTSPKGRFPSCLCLKMHLIINKIVVLGSS